MQPSQDWIFHTKADDLQDAGFNPFYLGWHIDKHQKHYKGNPFYKLLESLDESELTVKRVRHHVQTQLLQASLDEGFNQMLRDRLNAYKKTKIRRAKQLGGNAIIPPPAAVKNKTVKKGKVDVINEEQKQDEFKSPSPKQNLQVTKDGFIQLQLQTSNQPGSYSQISSPEFNPNYMKAQAKRFNMTPMSVQSNENQRRATLQQQASTFKKNESILSSISSRGKFERNQIEGQRTNALARKPYHFQTQLLHSKWNQAALNKGGRYRLSYQSKKEQSGVKSDASDSEVRPFEEADTNQIDQDQLAIRQLTTGFSNVRLNDIADFHAISEGDDEGMLCDSDSELIYKQPSVKVVFTDPILTATSQSKVHSRSFSFGPSMQYNNRVQKEPLHQKQSQTLNILDLAKADRVTAKKIYEFIDRQVILCDGEHDVIQYKKDANACTRSGAILVADQDAQNIQSSQAVQFSYGQYTFGGLMTVLKYFIDPCGTFNDASLTKMYAMNMHSVFLDIGSGFGFPSFMATCLTKCRSHGVEVVPARVKQSNRYVELLSNEDIGKGVDWKKLMNFELKNACKDQGPFTLKDGSHITHVFAYNWAQRTCEEYLPKVIARLNQTDFKLLAWNADEIYTLITYGLKARLVGVDGPRTQGKTTHQMYFYAKLQEEPESMHQLDDSSSAQMHATLIQQAGNSTSVSVRQQQVNQDESFNQVATSKLLDQEDELMMMTSKVKTPSKQRDQEADCDMMESKVHLKGCGVGLMKATNSRTQRDGDPILGKRKVNQISSTSKLEIGVRTPVKMRVKEVVTVCKEGVASETHQRDERNLQTTKTPSAQKSFQIKKRDQKLIKKQTKADLLIDLMRKAEETALINSPRISDTSKWKVEQQQLLKINRSMNCTMSTMMEAKGEQSSVYFGEMNNESKEKVAVKIYYSNFQKYARREDTAIKRMHMDSKATYSFFVVNKRYNRGTTLNSMIFMDQYPFSLTDWIQVDPPLGVLKLQLHMLVRGVAYCHAKGIAHRDIKTDNVLIGNDLVPKLIDFGMSSIHGEAWEYHSGGTSSFKAPEVKLQNMTQNLKAAKQTDCWSLGITIYTTLYGRTPWSYISSDWARHIAERDYPEIDQSDIELDCINKGIELPKDYQLANDLIRGLLIVNPSKRKTADDSIRHPFFDGCKYDQLQPPNVLELVKARDESNSDGRTSQLVCSLLFATTSTPKDD